MKIIHKYILKNVFINFLTGLSIFTFILFIGQILKMTELISKGVHVADLLHLFGLLIPYFLSACIPMAFLTAILLIFGRLSQDNELVAMRASGISLIQISYPIIIASLLLCTLCYGLNNNIIPKTHYEARKYVIGLGIKNPVGYIVEGTFIDIFPNHTIYVRERDGEHLKKVIIYQTTDDGLVKTITAKEGQISFNQDSRTLHLELIDGNIQEPNKENFNDFYNIHFGRYNLDLDASSIFQNPTLIGKKHKDMSIAEIKEKIKKLESQGIYPGPLTTEIQKKISISFSCLGFAFIGIPLGIRAHRSEKTIGIALSLILVFIYYLFIIVGKAFDGSQNMHPEFLMWVPNIILISLGLYLFRRVSKV
ncbi:MAG: LptF/LptG family permease [Chlamydiota bacterium]|nr:LptF/LptG family permease [Chlamydiota bacterium]